jgi:hypothetical protein
MTLATITTIYFLLFLLGYLGFLPQYVIKKNPYNGITLKTLRKGVNFFYGSNLYVKHVFDRATNKYCCLSDVEVIHLSGNTIVFTDKGGR